MREKERQKRKRGEQKKEEKKEKGEKLKLATAGRIIPKKMPLSLPHKASLPLCACIALGHTFRVRSVAVLNDTLAGATQKMRHGKKEVDAQPCRHTLTLSL